MEIENLIEEIVQNGKSKDMEALSEIFENSLEVLKEYDPDCYQKYEMELYKIAYGNHLNEEMAEKIVNKMKPYGKKWSILESENIMQDFGISGVSPTDFFIVLNSAYNDYRDIFEDKLDEYVKFTMDFILDEDAKEDKVFIYYTTIPKA